jgi:hypothetical protein
VEWYCLLRAYTVGYEHNQVKVNGEPRTYTLRTTHVYRREDGNGGSSTATATRRPSSTPRSDHPTAGR